VFKWLVWFGILVNATFWVPAWFAPPAFIKLLVDTTFGVTKGVFLCLGLRNPPDTAGVR
jgi:hypothetical protein